MFPITIIFYIGIFIGLYFSVFVLGTFLENRKSLYREEKGRKEYPSVCLIVPCYNEEKTIEKTVLSILNSDYPKDKLKVIVVDDGSKDKTLEKAKLFENTNRVKIFSKENGGKHTAMNLGIKNTDADFIGSVDADSFLHPKAVKRIIKHFEDEKTDVVIGSIKIEKAKNPIEKIQYVEFIMANLIRKTFAILNSVNVTPGPLSVFRREVFELMGPYRKGYQTEDLEFAFRLQSNNLKIDHAADALVFTKACPTFKSLFKQRLRWRRGFIMNLFDYTELLDFKKHGNLSLLITYSVLGSVISIALLSYSIWNIVSFVSSQINQLMLVGLDLPTKLSFNFDSLFFNLGLNPITVLGALAIGTIMLYIFFGKRLTFDKKPTWIDTAFYIILYAFLNVAWWIGAIYTVVARKKVTWR